MEQTDQPLTQNDRDVLRNYLRDQRQTIRFDQVSAVLAAVIVVTLLALLWGEYTGPVAGVALLGSGVTVWLVRRILRRRADLRPVRQALAAGRKTVSRGPLHAVAVSQPGCVVYRVGSGGLTLHAAAGALDLQAPPRDMTIVGLQHAQADAVTLHWVALGDARGVALRVDYAGLDEVRRETAPLDSEAIKRASGDARRLMGLIAIAFLIVFVQNVWTHGFALPGMLQTLAIASLALGVLLACMKIWQRRLARRQQGMEVLTGPVTEILTGRWGTNGRTYRATWFRVGDTLLCPGGASRGPVAIGDTVTIEILHGEGSGGRAALGAFTVTAAGAASAVRVETD